MLTDGPLAVLLRVWVASPPAFKSQGMVICVVTVVGRKAVGCQPTELQVLTDGPLAVLLRV